jgi:4-amino-4-deoxy-L-arabinose transferase-like glycosyltransferase
VGHRQAPAPHAADDVTERRYRWGLGLIVGVGLALRVAWVEWASRRPTNIFVDPTRYLGYAEQIAAGNGMTQGLTGDPTAYYPPGYPWFLGIIEWSAGPLGTEGWRLAVLVQAVLGAISIALAAHIARRLAGPLAGLVAAGAFALYPNLIFHTGALLGETLYIFFSLAFLALLVDRPWTIAFRTRRALACGVLLGLAVMVRPISLAIIPVVALCWLAERKDHRVVARWTVALVIGVGACILPWTVRNAIRLDAFVPISTNTGDNLCIGHADGATGAFAPVEACEVPYPFLDGLESELRSDEARQEIAWQGLRDNLDREPWLLWRRIYFTWVRDGDHDALFAVQEYRQDRWMAVATEARLIWVADRAYWAVTALGIVGLAGLARYRRPDGLLLVGATLMTALVPLAFFGDQRFKVPVIPLLIIAGSTLLRRREPEPAIGGGERSPSSDEASDGDDLRPQGAGAATVGGAGAGAPAS